PHPYLPGGVPPSSAVVTGAVALLLLLVPGVIRLWRRDRAVAVGGLWFAIALAPTLGFVQVGEQALADRYTYLPHVGLLLAAGRLGALGLARYPRLRPGAVASAAVMVFLLGGATHRQAQVWQGTTLLFESSLAATLRNPILLHHLGLDRARAGRLEEAFALQRQALELRPYYVEAHLELGLLLAELGQLDKAARQLELPLDIRPGWRAAEEAMARVLLAQGRPSEAVPHARRALEAAPGDRELTELLAHAEAGQAWVLLVAGAREEACAAWAAALAADRGIAASGALPATTTLELFTACGELAPTPPPSLVDEHRQGREQ
ncbi:MAG TPA: tetratricopeptide repeat protein, partial [Thermoanaerobaculia bacterium]|nr:tetratricopeptide repeat protein [Thermoanaerobaculia bacterium]